MLLEGVYIVDPLSCSWVSRRVYLLPKPWAPLPCSRLLFLMRANPFNPLSWSTRFLQTTPSTHLDRSPVRMEPTMAQRLTDIEDRQNRLAHRVAKLNPSEKNHAITEKEATVIKRPEDIDQRQADVDALLAALQPSAHAALQREHVLAHKEHTFSQQAHVRTFFLNESATSLINLKVCLDERWGYIVQRETAVRAKELKLSGREKNIETMEARAVGLIAQGESGERERGGPEG